MLEALYDWGGQPFAGVPLVSVLLIALVNFVGFLGRGAIGVGAIAVMVSVTALLIPAQHAVLLTLLASTVPQFAMLREGLRDSDWHVSRPVLVGLAISISAGVWIFARIDADAFAPLLGIAMALIVLLDTTHVVERLAPYMNLRSLWVAFVLSLFAGLLAGLSGAGGLLLLAVYLRHACRSHVALRATAVMLGSMILIWRTIAVGAAGLITVQLLSEALLMQPFLFAGVWVGQRFFRGMSPVLFNRLFHAVLALSAVGLLIDGLVKLWGR